MPEDIIEVKEKVNWKEHEFITQGGLCRNYITSTGYDDIALQFEKWYAIIPRSLKDEIITRIWEEFDFTISPTDKKWLILLNDMWDWAYLHSLVLTLQEYDQDEAFLRNTEECYKKRDFEQLWYLYYPETGV